MRSHPLNRISGMESRWVLLGFGLLFGILLLVFIHQNNIVQDVIVAIFTIFGFGGFWWNTTRDDQIETRFSQSR